MTGIRRLLRRHHYTIITQFGKKCWYNITAVRRVSLPVFLTHQLLSKRPRLHLRDSVFRSLSLICLEIFASPVAFWSKRAVSTGGLWNESSLPFFNCRCRHGRGWWRRYFSFILLTQNRKIRILHFPLE